MYAVMGDLFHIVFWSNFCYERKQLLLSAHFSHRNSVCPSVCHTGWSVKSGAS